MDKRLRQVEARLNGTDKKIKKLEHDCCNAKYIIVVIFDKTKENSVYYFC